MQYASAEEDVELVTALKTGLKEKGRRIFEIQ
jgi:hypothetical protein